MSWKHIADWAKHRPATLKLADRLGRSRGRLAILDRLTSPPASPYKPDLSNWENHSLAALWIGHATVLLRMGGMTILTDPVFSSRVGVGLGLITGGPQRLVAPALTLRELPKIDLILISHAHFDHLDRPTLARLPRGIPVVTARQTNDLIRDLGFKKVHELGWGEQVQFYGGLLISAHPAAHWGARTFHDVHRGFNSYVIEDKKHRVLFGGDTAFHDGFRNIGDVDLAIIGIGAYNPYIAAHATPEQAWEMANHCHAKFILPIHHRTFRLSHEPSDEPMERLLAVAGKEARRVVIRDIGELWIRD